MQIYFFPDPHLHSYPDHNPSNHTLTILMLAISESGPFPPSSSSKPHPHPYLFAHLQWAWPFPQWIGRAQLSIPSRPRRSGHGRKPAENDDKAHSKTKLHFGEIILREDKTVIIVHMYATNFGTVQWGEWYPVQWVLVHMVYCDNSPWWCDNNLGISRPWSRSLDAGRKGFGHFFLKHHDCTRKITFFTWTSLFSLCFLCSSLANGNSSSLASWRGKIVVNWKLLTLKEKSKENSKKL